MCSDFRHILPVPRSPGQQAADTRVINIRRHVKVGCQYRSNRLRHTVFWIMFFRTFTAVIVDVTLTEDHRSVTAVSRDRSPLECNFTYHRSAGDVMDL